MSSRFEFATATRIVFGAGTLGEAGAIAKTFGRRALVVTGRDRKRVEKLLTILRGAGLDAVPFSVPGEPELGNVDQGVAVAKEQSCDLVMSFGGGSAIDAGKAIAAMLANEGQLLDYLEVIGRGRALANPSVPYIAIPTTAGTGSEVTRNAVLASPEHRVKVSLRSPLMLARVALVDPELTYALPPTLTASTGLDALTQLIEPFVCSRVNPLTDALCVEGLSRAARSLRMVYEKGQNANAREDMSVASLFSGLALANAGLGAVHGFAGPIGGMFPAPHGAVCAALLPHAMRTNLEALRQRQPKSDTLRRFERVARLLTGRPAATADEGVDWIRTLVSDLHIPGLAAYGLKKQDAAELVEKAAHASSMKANPITLTPSELMQIFQNAL
jgi:alcohol dehydrogenase class IV